MQLRAHIAEKNSLTVASSIANCFRFSLLNTLLRAVYSNHSQHDTAVFMELFDITIKFSFAYLDGSAYN